MLKARLLIFVGLLAAVGLARAEWWTNQAGRVIEAKLGDFDGVWVTLVRTNATTLRMPLSALCENDQRRVLLQQGLSIAPDFVKAAYNDAVAVLARLERLPDGQRTEEGRKKAVLMACSVFDARIGARSAEITDKAVLAEVKRLRSLLANYGG
jgi:hypothetical protein